MSRIVTVRIALNENGMPDKVTVKAPDSGVFREVTTEYVWSGQPGWVLNKFLNGFDLKMYYDINQDAVDEEDE